MKIIISILYITIVMAIISCNAYDHHKDKNKEKRKSNIITIIPILDKNTSTANCIYCDNTRAMNGSCTCYFSVPVASCTGMNAGQGKSNSYKIYCSNLTSVGVWVKHNDTTFYCHYTGCPPEAYRAAFTADGR